VARANHFCKYLITSGDDILNSRETLGLVRAYNRISDRSERKRIVAVVGAMGGRTAERHHTDDLLETE